MTSISFQPIIMKQQAVAHQSPGDFWNSDEHSCYDANKEKLKFQEIFST
jgi:hypothetical protein